VEQEFQAPAHGTAAIDRGADLLVRVLESEQPVALTDLALAAGLPKSTASRLVSALERRGLIAQDGERGRLRPGPAILRVAERSMLERSLVEVSRSALDVLAEATGETINLSVPGPDGVEHIAQVDSRHFLGAGQWLGRSVGYEHSANGKVLAAFGRAPERASGATANG
jgi:IclR family transcriptional regulator, acetate operon repressor